GQDTLKGFNVNTLVLQVPRVVVRGPKGPVIGVWTTAERRSTRVEDSAGKVSSSGGFVQVSRLGMPLVNEAVVPVGKKDYFNGRRLQDDIIDVSLRVVERVLLPHHDPAAEALGDGVNANDVPFRGTFPYLALPHEGSDATPHA